eukprot:5653104-Pleurochrysis_carterae.AAC.1
MSADISARASQRWHLSAVSSVCRQNCSHRTHCESRKCEALVPRPRNTNWRSMNSEARAASLDWRARRETY